MRENLAEIKNSMNQMQSKLAALTASVNEAEEQISKLEDRLVEEKAKIETWLKKIQPQGRLVAQSLSICFCSGRDPGVLGSSPT